MSLFFIPAAGDNTPVAVSPEKGRLMQAFAARALVVLLALAPAAHAGGDAPEIDRLVRQLGSDSFEEREGAHKRLAAIGEPALGALRKAVGSRDAEVRRRAGELLGRIERTLFGGQLRLDGHTDGVYDLAFSADGRHAASAGTRSVRLWLLPR
jgi:hypothetical protein